jgi:hypothetical protein
MLAYFELTIEGKIRTLLSVEAHQLLQPQFSSPVEPKCVDWRVRLAGTDTDSNVALFGDETTAQLWKERCDVDGH